MGGKKRRVATPEMIIDSDKEEDDDDDEHDDDDGDEDELVPQATSANLLGSSLLAGLIKRKPTTAETTPKATVQKTRGDARRDGAGASSGISGKGGRAASASVISVRSGTAVRDRSRSPKRSPEASSEGVKKARGKGARIPTNSGDLLEHEGYNGRMKELHAQELLLLQKPFNIICLSSEQLNVVKNACLAIVVKVDSLIVNFQEMDSRIGKRTSKPKDVLETIRNTRSHARNMSALLTDVVKPTFDVEKLSNLMEVMIADKGLTFGVFFRARIYENEAIEHVRFAKWGDLANLVCFCSSNDFKDQKIADVKALNDVIVERGSLRIGKGAKNKIDDDLTVLYSLHEFTDVLLKRCADYVANKTLTDLKIIWTLIIHNMIICIY